MSGYPIENEYQHQEQTLGKGHSIGIAANKEGEDLLGILSGIFAFALVSVICIMVPILFVPVLLLAFCIALGKLGVWANRKIPAAPRRSPAPVAPVHSAPSNVPGVQPTNGTRSQITRARTLSEDYILSRQYPTQEHPAPVKTVPRAQF